MRLKGIELLGFKSFLDRTVLTFPHQGLTAIVGPNGCGKSNLVDAVLWALGEMRPTHLRGRAMEDVIFNGTEEVKPSGMAEVSLIFDTSEGAPPGFERGEELRVTRRLFRSGESQYLINRRPCRLKDIRDLFLGTGLGINAYAVVPQGEVEALITAPPQQIRFMIEEAAGVSRYQERKRETLRKMENTRQNLERLKDLLAEVERQANSLRYQASKARRFKRMKEELRQLEVSEAAMMWEKKRRLYEEMGKEATRLREELLRVQRKRRELEEDLEELEGKFLEGQQELEATERRSLEVEGEIKGKEERLRALEGELEALRERLSEARKEVSRLRGLVEELLERRALAEKEVDELREGLSSKRASFEAVKARILEGEPQRAALIGKRDRLRREVLELEGERIRMNNALKEAEGRLREIAQRGSRLEEELHKALEEEGALQGRIEELRGEEQKLQASLQGLVHELRSIEESRSDLEGRLAEKKEELSKLTGQLEALKMRGEMLRKMETEHEGYPEAVKALLRDPSSAGISKAVVLGDLIEVEPGYEKAVEAALGERIKALVVETMSDALKVLRRMQGRIAVLPAKAGTGKDGGDLGRFVRAKGYEGLIRRLLDGISLVDHLPTDINPGEGDFVTKDGELLDNKGTLWGNLSTGLLQRKNLLKEVEARTREISLAVQRAEGELEGLRSSLARLQEKEAELKARQSSQEEVLRELRGTITQLEAGLQATRRKVSILQMEVEDLKGEERTWQGEKEEITRRIREWEGRWRTTREELEQIERALQKQEAQRKDLQEEATSLREGIATLEERLRGREAALKELKSRIEQAEREQKRHLAEISSLEKRIREAEERKGREAQAFKELMSQREELSLLLVQRRQAMEEVLGRLEEVKGELKAQRTEEDRLREEVARAEKQLQGLAVEVEHLERSLRGTFGVEPSEALKELEETPLPEGYKERMEELRQSLQRMGDVYMGAIEEYAQVRDRLKFLEAQKEDLEQSLETLHRTLERINRRSRELFLETLERTRETFAKLVERLFAGGRGEMVLDGGPEPGVRLMIQPRGKRLKSMELLSRGEKTMAAIAFILSLFLLRPAPFCLMDEVDSPLDEANIERFLRVIEELRDRSQFILVTHQKRTMEAAEALYGVTMEIPGVSKVLSLKLR